MEIRYLQYNHMNKPIGVDGTNPRISWNLADGCLQTAYRIDVMDENGTCLYAAEEESSRMYVVLDYTIPAAAKVVINVTVWDEEMKPSKTESLTVITGLAKESWQAKWISPELTHPEAENRRAGYLKKEFDITDLSEAAKGAYLYATCHGLMNIYLNGQEISEHLLMPGTQQYNKRLMVETMDVSFFLKEGKNELLVSLGDGWYRGSMGNGQIKNIYGDDLSFLAQLQIGGTLVLVTDETWSASTNGPIGRNDFMWGEAYDATKEKITDWHEVRIEHFGYENLISVDTVPVTAHETFRGTYIQTANGEKVLDFGQNLVGYLSFEIEGRAGQKIKLSHGETLDREGNFTIKNFQSSRVPMTQDIHYICKDGKNSYHPTKTYMGFRYVKVEADFDIPAEAFTAFAIYSDIRQTGFFNCGVTEVNQLFTNALWSMKGNFVDVPTDCPTREKSGYSGDCQTFVHTAMYLMDCYPVYAKWIREQAAGQYEDGVVPQVAPKANSPREKEMLMGVLPVDGGIGWSDAFEIVPYHLFKRTGDPSLFTELYEQLKEWTEYEIQRAKETRLVNEGELPEEYREYMIDSGFMWGEWLEPGQTEAYVREIVQKGDPEIGTAFFYMNLRYMAEMAVYLGKNEDAKRYSELAEKAKAGYRAVFLDQGHVKERKRQCRYVRPIAHDLLTKEEKAVAAADLAKMIEANNNHLNTGFLSTHELCRSLSQNGQNKKAYDLLLQKEMPGWLYAVLQGCTTTPERWDFLDEDNNPRDSFNHYAYGAVVGWLMDCVCGIQVTDGTIRIEPYPDERLGFAEATYESPYGRIRSAWRYEEDKFCYEITIPSNMTAEVKLPGQEIKVLGSGEYCF